MIDKEEARDLAMEKILADWNVENDEPVILDKYTIEKDFGWVFFYSSRKYQETRIISYALAGNAPIIVNKFDSSLYLTGTAQETEYYINKYEAILKNQKSD